MQPTLQEQAAKLAEQAAGFIGVRTAHLGLRHGLFALLAEATNPLTPDELAKRASTNPFYTEVWCRSAMATALLDAADGRYRLAPHVATPASDTTASTPTAAHLTTATELLPSRRAAPSEQ